VIPIVPIAERRDRVVGGHHCFVTPDIAALPATAPPGGDNTESVKALVAAAPPESTRRAVKLLVAIAVGVPEITPALLIERPVGRDPAETDDVYGV